MFPLFDRPTRITSHSATLLENIFTIVFDNKIKSCGCVSDITDHYPIFQITSSLSIKNRSCRTNYTVAHSLNVICVPLLIVLNYLIGMTLLV